MEDSAWVRGDLLGLDIPAHSDALREGAAAFLTHAFRASGALAQDNEVSRISQFDECPGGSTGRKLLLSVEYGRPAAGLNTDLFVKFSRDFSDAIRDRGKDQLESEVRLGLLSRAPGFPITVPACMFADYNKASGTGILITERIAFGRDGIERPYEKCMDYEMPDALGHYRALITALARLAGAHRAGRLPESVAVQFPFDPDQSVRDRIPYNARQLQNRVSRYAAFAADFPRLLPPNITSPAFIADFSENAVRFLEQEDAIKRFLSGNNDFIALCHWNTNVDNAWFWRGDDGSIKCGLLDWGRVNQMNVALALLGGLSAAEVAMWDEHLDDLLALFATQYHAAGGPRLDVDALRLHLCLFAAMMVLAWLIDAPPIIRAQVPDLAEVKSRFDPRLRANETARAQLHMLTTFLNLWQTRNFSTLLDDFVRRETVSAAG